MKCQKWRCAAMLLTATIVVGIVGCGSRLNSLPSSLPDPAESALQTVGTSDSPSLTTETGANSMPPFTATTGGNTMAISTGTGTTGHASTPPVEIEDIRGAQYQASADPFYQQSSLYVTWLNCWNGSTEYWWGGLAKTTSVNGIRALLGGEYVCLNSANPNHRIEIAKYAMDAGIQALAMDLTNGYSGWVEAAKHYQKLCYQNGCKFTAAVHPTDPANLESICQFIWKTYAGPGVATYSPAYLYKNGKPLLVLYCTADEFAQSTSRTDGFRSKFTFVWASGEDSQKDKWGWQLEPQDGPMLSKDSMYVTGSLAWNSPQGSSGSWRMSLAWLDFNFLARQQMQPKFTIVGSMDDLFERNGWMIADTSQAFYQMPLDPDASKNRQTGRGMQMRDATGAINNRAFYDRVSSWIKGTAAPFYNGGVLADGAYTIRGVSSQKCFGVQRPSARQEEDIGAVFYQNFQVSTPMESYYWFYHLGNNEYRVIKLTSGLSLQTNASYVLTQEWTEESEAQRWVVKEQKDGSFCLINKKTGRALQDGTCITTQPLNTTALQKWTISPVAGRTFS